MCVCLCLFVNSGSIWTGTCTSCIIVTPIYWIIINHTLFVNYLLCVWQEVNPFKQKFWFKCWWIYSYLFQLNLCLRLHLHFPDGKRSKDVICLATCQVMSVHTWVKRSPNINTLMSFLELHGHALGRVQVGIQSENSKIR